MEAKYIIQNLKCGGCAHTIITKLSTIENIHDTSVDVENSMVQFHYNNENALMEVKNKLSSLGYPIEGDANSIVSKAKSFVSCAVGKLAKN